MIIKEELVCIRCLSRDVQLVTLAGKGGGERSSAFCFAARWDEAIFFSNCLQGVDYILQ